MFDSFINSSSFSFAFPLSINSAAKSIPVLRKDFVVDEYMVYESKILGADAILLIAGVLDEITLMRCVNLAHNLGM